MLAVEIVFFDILFSRHGQLAHGFLEFAGRWLTSSGRCCLRRPLRRLLAGPFGFGRRCLLWWLLHYGRLGLLRFLCRLFPPLLFRPAALLLPVSVACILTRALFLPVLPVTALR